MVVISFQQQIRARLSESVQTFDNDSHEIPIILPPLAIVVSSLSSPTGDVGARVELTMSCRRNMQRNNCETHTVFKLGPEIAEQAVSQLQPSTIFQ